MKRTTLIGALVGIGLIALAIIISGDPVFQ